MGLQSNEIYIFLLIIFIKVKAKAQNSWFVFMCEDDEISLNKLVDNLSFYQVIEAKLKKECNFQGPASSTKQFSHNAICEATKKTICPSPIDTNGRQSTQKCGRRRNLNNLPRRMSEKNIKLKLADTVLYLNRYCAKLPSDTL